MRNIAEELFYSIVFIIFLSDEPDRIGGSRDSFAVRMSPRIRRTKCCVTSGPSQAQLSPHHSHRRPPAQHRFTDQIKSLISISRMCFCASPMTDDTQRSPTSFTLEKVGQFAHGLSSLRMSINDYGRGRKNPLFDFCFATCPSASCK